MVKKEKTRQKIKKRREKTARFKEGENFRMREKGILLAVYWPPL